jgi:hypothetical protein
MKRAKSKRQRRKKKMWNIPTLLGILIGLVGAAGVIELRPQLSVTPDAQLRTSQPFSAPFRITNTGYLSVKISYVILYLRQVDAGIVSFRDSTNGNRDWDNFTLDRGDSKSIVSLFLDSPRPPQKTDIVWVIYYEFLGKTWRRYFRFQGAYMDNWQWLPQPYGDIEDDIKKYADEGLAKHKKAIGAE